MKRMKGFSSFKIFSLYIALLFSIDVFSTPFQWEKLEGTSFKIAGTSTLHDWEADVTLFSLSADLDLKDGVVKSIKKVKYSAQSIGIKSGKDGMDEKIYEALKEPEHKEISFEMVGVESLKDNQFVIKGKLKIAGVEQEIKLAGSFFDVKQKSFRVKVSHPLKMSDFKIEPPSVFVISAGDEITINFDLSMIEAK